MIKIKINKGHKELQGKVLSLVEISEMIYKCHDTNIEIVDTWNELKLLSDWSKKYNSTIFYDLHLFRQSETELQFIDKIEYLND